MKPLTPSLLTSLLLVISLFCHAEPRGMAAEGTAAGHPADQQANPIKKLSETEYQIGKATIDKTTRCIRFPAFAECVSGEIIEFITVNPEGRIHEALFITELDPMHLNLAFKLLGYPPSRELFRKRDKFHRPNGEKYTVSDETKARARFNISISWQENGKCLTQCLASLLLSAENANLLPPEPWVYHGSYFYKGEFAASLNRDLIALRTDEASIAGYPGALRDNHWTSNKKLLPKVGTPVTLTLTPNEPLDKKPEQSTLSPHHSASNPR